MDGLPPVESLDACSPGDFLPLRILVVEDEPLQRALIKRILEKQIVGKVGGVEVVVTAVGTMAEALVEAPHSNVTILDLALPDSDPDQTIAAIRRFRPPVIIMTGTDDPELIAECLKAGAEHVFVKGAVHGLARQVLDCMIRDVRIIHAYGPQEK